MSHVEEIDGYRYVKVRIPELEELNEAYRSIDRAFVAVDVDDYRVVNALHSAYYLALSNIADMYTGEPLSMEYGICVSDSYDRVDDPEHCYMVLVVERYVMGREIELYRPEVLIREDWLKR